MVWVDFGPPIFFWIDFEVFFWLSPSGLVRGMFGNGPQRTGKPAGAYPRAHWGFGRSRCEFSECGSNEVRWKGEDVGPGFPSCPGPSSYPFHPGPFHVLGPSSHPSNPGSDPSFGKIIWQCYSELAGGGKNTLASPLEVNVFCPYLCTTPQGRDGLTATETREGKGMRKGRDRHDRNHREKGLKKYLKKDFAVSKKVPTFAVPTKGNSEGRDVRSERK